jgi:hypothetical protein
MPVLDFHVHVGRRDHLTPSFIDYYGTVLGPEALQVLDDLTPEGMSHYLDGEAVDHAVVLAEYSPSVTGVVPNEFTADFCSRSHRLTAFGSLDPRSRDNAGEQVEYCVKRLGCKGIKLLPSYGHYSPSDPWLYPAYEVAQNLNVPVMFHTGTSLFPGTKVRYAHPLLLDEVAEDFRRLSIVMSHGGRPFWYKEAEWMLRRHANVFVDISGIPPQHLLEAFPKMDQLSERFVFGSDWPNIPSVGAQVARIQALPLSQRTLDNLLWDNGARLLSFDR